MNENPKPVSHTCQVFTNSIIKVSIPEEYRQLGPIAIEWTSKPQDQSKLAIQNFLANTNVEHSEQYACSPLNYGNIVYARVILVQDADRYILE